MVTTNTVSPYLEVGHDYNKHSFTKLRGGSRPQQTQFHQTQRWAMTKANTVYQTQRWAKTKANIIY